MAQVQLLAPGSGLISRMSTASDTIDTVGAVSGRVNIASSGHAANLGLPAGAGYIDISYASATNATMVAVLSINLSLTQVWHIRKTTGGWGSWAQLI